MTMIYPWGIHIVFLTEPLTGLELSSKARVAGQPVPGLYQALACPRLGLQLPATYLVNIVGSRDQAQVLLPRARLF